MSYDLTLHPRPGEAFSREAFQGYFTDRPNFSLNGDEASYENETTGVYFHLTYREPEEEAEQKGKPAELRGGPRIWFNINFCRPRFFGREAAQGLREIIAGLRLMIHSEAGDDITDPDRASEEMLAQWNRGNEWACRAILAMHGSATGIYPVPAEALMNYWDWSFNRDELAEDLFDLD